MTTPAPHPNDTRLVEVLDRLLDRGVALKGELWLTVADVDLVFIGVQAIIASPDTVFGAPEEAS